MTFISFLKSNGINRNTPGPAGKLYAIMSAMGSDSNDYRTASLAVADFGEVADVFAMLWDRYETELDVMYNRPATEPEPAAEVIRRVIDGMRQAESGAGT